MVLSKLVQRWMDFPGSWVGQASWKPSESEVDPFYDVHKVALDSQLSVVAGKSIGLR